MTGRRLGAQRLERINGRLVSVPDIGPRPSIEDEVAGCPHYPGGFITATDHTGTSVVPCPVCSPPRNARSNTAGDA